MKAFVKSIQYWSIWAWVAGLLIRVKALWVRMTHVAVSRSIAGQFKSCGLEFHIYRPFKLNGIHKIEVGSNVHINSYSIIQGSGGVIIGDNVHIGPRLTLYSTSHNYESQALPYDETVIRKPVVIEDNVWIGACVTIVPGVTIGEGAVIAAGTVVAKDVPPLEVIGGGGHRTLKKRDEQHYKSLAVEKKFGGVGGKPFIPHD